MTKALRRRVSGRTHGDDGIALVVSIALIGLVAILVLVLVAVALSEARASGRDRQRSVAVMSAEGRVDTLLATIQSADPLTLPCGPLATDSETVMSDDLALDTTVTYYDSVGTEVPCADVTAGVPVLQASVRTTAQSDAIAGTSPARRTIETLIKLTPSFSNDLDKAIFGDDGVVVNNNGTLTTADGQPIADVYTNGDFVCEGNQEYMGSVYAQGSIDITNSCLVAVDAHAGHGIDANHSQATVNGRALAAGGNILFKGHLGQYARATGTATGDGCSPGTKCVGGVAVQPPPAESFPVVTWTGHEAEWAAGGYTNVVRFPQDIACAAPTGSGDKDDAVGEWIKNNGSTLPAKTVIVADCPGIQVYQSGINVSLSNSLAIFSTAGIKIDGNPVIKSTSGDKHYLHLIQPHGSTCSPTTGIYLGNNVEFTQTVGVMAYSPCDIEKHNQSELFGQIYSGGTAYLTNRTDMTYEMVPMFGVDSVSSRIEHYDVEILYKRENV